MTPTRAVLENLIKRLAGLHPDDAAAVVAELSEPHRALLMEFIRKPIAGDSAIKPETDRVISPWLFQLTKPDSLLTDHARASLARHIGAMNQPSTIAFQSPSRGRFAVRTLWRALIGAGLRA